MYKRYEEDNVTALGAEMTFNFILAFFPFIAFLLTLISYLPITGEFVLYDLSKVLPTETYKMVLDITGQIMSSRSTTLLSFGMLVTLWVASNGISAIISGLNKAYDQKETRPFWKVKLISFFFTLAIAMMIIFSFTTIVFGRLIGEYFFNYIGFSAFFTSIWNYLRYLITLLGMFLVFLTLYHYIPNRRLTFKEVIPGALFCTIGWIITSILFSFYVNNFGNFSVTYGSIGGAIVLLLWLNWSSIIILLGGELNATLKFDRHKT
ncbi:MAG: YihY/virulence factor BrkB family protein [Clostridia bacterium]|nr:YihY/virulence factor BrkB family protein [Clostridia bacterium]